jgi:glutamate racemase
MDGRPIGVLDSGIGGLTVVREIVRELPNESLVFLGDTARVPYGTRGTGVITGFAVELAEFLVHRQVKCVVAACNTISSTCLELLQDKLPVPVIGVVAPAVREAVQRTTSGRIGLLGTRATVASKAYETQIKALGPDIDVTARACPMFVPLAEEGMIEAQATRLIAEEYLHDLRGREIDTVILGCTHYPLLRGVIQQVLGPEVTLIDSARPTAVDLAQELTRRDALSNGTPPTHELFVTDAPERVQEVASLFFGDAIPSGLRKTTLGQS